MLPSVASVGWKVVGKGAGETSKIRWWVWVCKASIFILLNQSPRRFEPSSYLPNPHTLDRAWSDGTGPGPSRADGFKSQKERPMKGLGGSWAQCHEGDGEG